VQLGAGFDPDCQSKTFSRALFPTAMRLLQLPIAPSLRGGSGFKMLRNSNESGSEPLERIGVVPDALPDVHRQGGVISEALYSSAGCVWRGYLPDRRLHSGLGSPRQEPNGHARARNQLKAQVPLRYSPREPRIPTPIITAGEE
jgi:hypothetical protein